MNSFKEQNLEIKPENKLNEVLIKWLGRSDLADPSKSLTPYFSSLVEEMPKKKLILDFAKLEFMNSSTVPAIINLVKILNEKGVATQIVYDASLQWQRSSFNALKIVCMKLTNVKIEAIS